jgi:hypothetical protein
MAGAFTGATPAGSAPATDATSQTAQIAVDITTALPSHRIGNHGNARRMLDHSVLRIFKIPRTTTTAKRDKLHLNHAFNTKLRIRSHLPSAGPWKPFEILRRLSCWPKHSTPINLIVNLGAWVKIEVLQRLLDWVAFGEAGTL